MNRLILMMSKYNYFICGVIKFLDLYKVYLYVNNKFKDFY